MTAARVVFFLGLIATLGAAAVYAQAGAAEKPAAAPGPGFVYRSPQGVEFEVTAEGLSAIRVGGRTLASGGWSVFNAEPWFKDAGSGAVKTGPVERKTLEVLGPRQARVVPSRRAGRLHDRLHVRRRGRDDLRPRSRTAIPTSRSTSWASPGLTFDFRPAAGRA